MDERNDEQIKTEHMNEIAMNATSKKLTTALKTENLSNQKFSNLSGIHANYIGQLQKPEYFNKAPKWAWQIILRWGNSGEKLKDYNWERAANDIGIQVKSNPDQKTKPMTAEDLTEKIKEEHPVDQEKTGAHQITVDNTTDPPKKATFEPLLELDEKWNASEELKAQAKQSSAGLLNELRAENEHLQNRINRLSDRIEAIDIQLEKISNQIFNQPSTSEPLIDRAQMTATPRTITIKVKV